MLNWFLVGAVGSVILSIVYILQQEEFKIENPSEALGYAIMFITISCFGYLTLGISIIVAVMIFLNKMDKIFKFSNKIFPIVLKRKK